MWIRTHAARGGSPGLRRMLVRTLALAALALAVLPAAPASAGRLFATGHDADLHCADGAEQCGLVKVAVDYVRSGAPDPTKPVLILDRGNLQMEAALDRAYGTGVVPRRVVDPRSAEFQGLALSTSAFSAILVASDTTCGGCDLNESDSTPDSNAINRRKDAITAFFNDGGGLYANAGANHGDGDDANGADTYYGFLPLPVGGQRDEAPFCLTAAGRAIGLQDSRCPDASKRTGTRDDINCCATHNSFEEPPRGSSIVVAERDASDAPETLIADGIAGGGTIRLPPPVLGETANVAPVKGRVFVSVPRRRSRASGRLITASLAAVPGLKGRTFVPLRQARQVPVGSLLDTRRGTVRLSTARNRAGKVQSAKFLTGVFQVLQSRKRRAKGLTELRLKGSSFKRCSPAGRAGSNGSGAEAVSSGSRTIRRLRGSGSGRFSTRGRRSAATVRSTIWTVIDRCDGTLTKVTRGTVAVRDFRRKKTIIVRAGKSYLAR